MQRNKPQISIVIPACNRVHTIERTIESFIAQDYKDWEMMIVDDHSKDNTREVVETYCLQDSRINYIVNERKKGAQGARNTGILHAKNEWVVIFDSDDYAHSSFLRILIDAISDDVDVVSCDINAVNTKSDEQQVMQGGDDGILEKKLMQQQAYVYFDAAVIRKSKLLEIGLLDENCPAYQEFDTHIRLSRICTYKRVPQALVDWYVGGEDTITSKAEMNRGARCYIVWSNRKRWRKVAYRGLVHEGKSLFVRTEWKYQKLLIKAVPEVLLLLPAIYMNVIIRKINKRFKIKIPQL